MTHFYGDGDQVDDNTHWLITAIDGLSATIDDLIDEVRELRKDIREKL